MNNMKTDIFKIQRPLDQSSGIPTMVLIYNKSREHMGQFPMSDELADMMGKKYKIYVEGMMDKDGMLNIIKEVPTQPW